MGRILNSYGKPYRSSRAKFQENPDKIIVQSKAKGSTGTEIFAGTITEEYLTGLTGSDRADCFDKMRRSDSKVKMNLSAVKNPLRSAQWSWINEDQDEKALEHSRFLDHAFFNDIGRNRIKKEKKLLTEWFSIVDFGHLVMERTHKLVENHPEFGTYHGLGSFDWRSPRTIEYWNINKETKELESVTQCADGDLASAVKMDARFLTIASLEMEGDNYEGIGLLRSAYGAWLRKQTYLKMMAIGIEKYAIPTPIADVPEGKQNTEEFDNLIEALEIYTSHESNYLTKPTGWEITWPDSKFDPGKLIEAIQFEDKQITFSFLANFLELGMSGGGGSFALGQDLSDFFLGGIEYIAETVADEVNEVGKELILMKYGPQPKYPKLKASGISDKVGKDFGELLKTLTEGNILIPDDQIEEQMRKRLNLPGINPDDRREKTISIPGMMPQDPNNPQPPPSNPQPKEKPEGDKELKKEDVDKEVEKLNEGSRAIMFAEMKANKLIKDNRDFLKVLMNRHLSDIGSDLIKQVMKEYKGLSDKNKINATKNIKARKLTEYKKVLKASLADVADQGLGSARDEVPSSKSKFAEFEDLPPEIKKLITLRSLNLIETQGRDLEKAVIFSFGDALMRSEDPAVIEFAMKQKVEAHVQGPTVVAAAGNTSAVMINEARNAFFFDDDTLEEIESFTFTNSSPVAPICVDLAGKTFRKDDPKAQEYFPPLHHNCDSIIVANLIGGRRNPSLSPEGLRPSDPKLKPTF